MQDAKEEVRNRLNIEDVVGEYVRLQRAGRSLKGLSPFTSEKTPSFMVSPDKHVWYDFSSQSGGDIFSFIMKIEGLDFRGALELLARKAGVDLSLYQSGDRSLGKKKQRLYDLLDLATIYYQQTLLKNKRALDYVFTTRKLQKKTVQNFRLGFAPDTVDAIVQFLVKKGYTTQEIKEAGLTNRRGGDLFRSRIIIPLMDDNGNVIGFTGRLLGEDAKAPKYLNTPQTLLYDKSRHVFGLSQAKEAIRKDHTAILVEGNIDVISSHQANVCSVVAAAGTALTKDHLQIIKRFAPRVLLAFDSDKAGLAATERAIHVAQQLDMELSIVDMPPGTKDPDELIQQDIKLWKKAIDDAVPAVDWVIDTYQSHYDLSSAEGKKKYTSQCLTIIGLLVDEVEKDHYIRRVAEIVDVQYETLIAKFRNVPSQKNSPLRHTTYEKKDEKAPFQTTDTLLSIAAFDPTVRGLLVELGEDVLIDDEAKQLLEYLQKHPDVSLADRLPQALRKIETYVKIAVLKADERYGAWSSLDRYDETARLIKLIQHETKQQHKEKLTKQLQQAENAHDDVAAENIRNQLNILIKEMK